MKNNHIYTICGTQMYRGQSDMGMNEKAGGDSDYRIPPPNITSINNQNCDTTLLPPPLPPAALDTPPLLKMDDFMVNHLILNINSLLGVKLSE